MREIQGGELPYRTHGVYVVIGGAGGLGEVFSKALIERYQAQMIWIGRRELDADMQAKLDALSRLGPAPYYISADARNRQALQNACEEIKAKFGAIHGVVHAALGNYDQSLAEMDEVEFQSVLSVKVDVSVRIAQVFQQEPLDFALFFSSLAAFGKTRGMSSYAAGCTFKDAFSLQLSNLWSCTSKVMNWGYWSIGGGARISDTLRRHLEQSEGIQAIEPAEGMEALDNLLSGHFRQLAFVKTRKPQEMARVHAEAWMAHGVSIVSPCVAPLRERALQVEAPTLHPGIAELNGWMVRLLFAQFTDLGILQQGVAQDVATLRQEAGILDKYDLWFHEVMQAFAASEYIRLDNGTATLNRTYAIGDSETVWREWEARKQHFDQDAELRPLADIVDECFRKLQGILRGTTLITDILFPEGSTEKMEVVYKDNAVARYFNEALTEVATAYIEQRLQVDPQPRLRILEIGAGTGGTTSTLLPQLRPFQDAIAEYCYTDLSKSFLLDAKERYGPEYAYMVYKVCDIEQPLASQDIQIGGYDMVIATNVLHATKSMRNTLRNTKAALAQNGVLLLNEMTEKTVFATLIFGLIDGWSLAEDTAIRMPGSPGLTPESWQWLLQEEGFKHIAFPTQAAQALGQQIMVAASDGVIRQSASEPWVDLQPRDAEVVAPPTGAPQEPMSSSQPEVQDLGDYVKQQIVYCLSQSLRVAEHTLDHDVPFSDYGMDSILGANFVNQVGDALGIELNTTIIFDHSTVDRLTSHVATTFKNRIQPPVVADSRGVAVPPNPAVAPDPSVAVPNLPESATDRVEPPRERRSGSDIAVIGMSGQFPGAENTDAFWENLISGHNAVGELPPPYLNRQKYYSPARQKGKTYCHQGGVLEDRDCFDPLFFNLSPRDAESMNPHQRLILQESWRALEDAGYNPRSLSETRTGAFVGSEPTGYFHETFTGASEAIVASRLSYFLNLRGPAFVVNTGCSSSGAALHLACESLRNGESTLALAGGVFASMSHASLIPLSEIEMLSPSGRCSSFDAAGDGMVLSEGVGMVVLKRLGDAEKDGDAIYGVIKASGLNQDGASNGITAPSGVAQEELIAGVYRRYGINPEDISYVEAHGTGTRLGDPVEANALTRAFRQFTDKTHFCALGSAKAHIGHTAASAAVVGLIKVLLSLKHQKLPGLLHFQTLNPQIEFEDSPFYIKSELTDWHRVGQKPLLAALNSFGHSGTNVHMVIGEYQPARTSQSVAPVDYDTVMVPISAKDEERLREAVRNLYDHLDGERVDRLSDLAYTLQTGREAMSQRVAFVVSSIEELKKQLKGFLNREPLSVAAHSRSSLSASMEDAGARVTRWLADRDLEQLATFWSQGGQLDWQALYGDSKPLRIHLPTYPFAKERYWASTPEQYFEEVAPPSGLLLVRPEWTEAMIPADAPAIDPHAERLVLTLGIDAMSRRDLESRLHNATVVHLYTEARTPEQRYEALALQVFEQIQTQLREKSNTKTLAQLCIGSGKEASLLHGIAGLLQTAQQENPKLTGQIIEIDVDASGPGLVQQIEENARCPEDGCIRYSNGTRQVMVWRELISDTSATGLPWRDEGVYLITGGAGGLGLIFAEEIARQVHRATLILIGRSPLNRDQQERINTLAHVGAVVEYRQVDVSRQGDVRELIQHIHSRYGGLHGILHSAGVHKDNYLIHKTQAEFRAVLEPKVAGTVYLDQYSSDRSLDFVILFSSGAGVTGNVGQADYAVANAFMDQFASYRQRLVEAGQRRGRTLSINWPLWQEGGMRVDPGTEAMMRDKSGMVAMSAAVGLEAFYQAWRAGHPQVGVVSGDLDKIRQRLVRKTAVSNPPRRDTSSPSIDTNDLRSKTLEQLKALLGAQIKLSPDRISSQEPFERYGIDSIVITELNQGLEAIFGDIAKTLFFEYQTLSALTDYFIEEYPQACANWTDMAQPQPIASDPASVGVEPLALNANLHLQEPIAIIGISGHYPQADSLDTFWMNLEAGKDCITEIPPERWPLDEFYHEHPEDAVAQGKSYGKWGSFLEGFADFDPLFFNISGREAMSMDPQERIFLQSAWEALEDAGYTRHRLETQFDNNVGVFAGITKTGYDLYGSAWRQQGKLFYPHTSFGSVANRVSYLLNLRGPSMPIDTMCSSSLTAIHEACERLRQGVCHMAIAGGVNLYLHPTNYVELSALKMLSKDGKCRSFGKGGDGFVPGEGVGVVLLKPLSRAMADKDRIHAVIRATSVNHGGKTNGYTVPNPKAQGALIRETLNKAGVHARTVSYVEAHGTGTELGDPIEVRGLTQAFESDTAEVGFCALGSIKSNIGHLEAVAGIAGLTKILLQMQHQKLVPSLHANELNPNISFEKTPFYVQQTLEPWNRPVISLNGETKEYPRIASVSSFGAGGANAHVVLEEYCETQVAAIDESQPPVAIVLSAKNEDRLRAYAASLLEHVWNRLSDAQLRDLAYTLQIGREAMDERLGLWVRSGAELIDKLNAFLEHGEPIDDLFRGRVNHEQEMVMAQDAVEPTSNPADLARLLEQWVQGHTIDWTQLYGSDQPRRIGAPTYPFARELYWIAPSESTEEVQRAAILILAFAMGLRLRFEANFV